MTLSVTTTVKHRPSKNKYILLSSDTVCFLLFHPDSDNNVGDPSKAVTFKTDLEQ